MNRFFTSWKHPRKKSVFTAYFFLILALVFLLMFAFSAYISFTSSSSYKQQQQLAEQSVLMQASDRVDNTLYMVNRLAAGTAQNSDVIATAIAPSQNDPQRNFNIISTLNALVDENVYIDHAYLYEHSQGYVFTSDSMITTLSGMVDSPLIAYCLFDPGYRVLRQETNRFLSRIVQDGCTLYLVYDFIYTNSGPLNTLILELNTPALFESFLKTPSLDQYDVTVYGEKVSPIYSTPNQNSEAAAGIAPLTMVSSYTGWTYTVYAKAASGLFAYWNLKQFLPFLLILCAASVIVTYFITRRAYSPIEHLTNLIHTGTRQNDSEDPSSAEQVPKVNEFAFLETAYRKLIQDNRAAADLIETVRPDLEHRLLTELLAQEEMTPEEVHIQLQQLGSSMHMEDKYQVLLFQLRTLSEADHLSLHLSLFHLQQTVRKCFDPAWGSFHILADNDRSFRLVICYPQITSMAQIKRVLRTFHAALEKEMAGSSIPFEYAAGNVCSQIMDIHSSMEDAVQQLHQIVYYSDAAADEAEVVSAKEHPELNYYSSLITQISEKISAGDFALAQTYLDRFLKEQSSCILSLEDKRAVCQQLLDMLIERVLPYQLEDQADVTTSYAGLSEHLAHADDTDSLLHIVQQEVANLMETLSSEAQMRQKRLIARAKEFISSNYSNCDLSINEIAQYVGYSASYLSTVFSEYTGDNLISYLNNYRVTMAKDLLINSQILIKDIGFKAGFNTVQNFNRVFKKNTGMTPNEYRKTYRK